MLTLAQEAARRAGEVLRRHFGSASLGARAKGQADFVTEVDLRAEEVIRELLEAEVPDHALLLSLYQSQILIKDT